jgi:signal transduction histidine kinase
VPLRIVLFLMMVALGLKERWPARLQPWYIAYSYLALLLALPFFNVHLALERGGGIAAISNCFIALALLTLLVDWRNQVAMLVIGVGAALAVFRLRHPDGAIPGDLVRQVPAFLVILGASYVFKYTTEQVDQERRLLAQQRDNERRLGTVNDLLAFMAHELNTPLATIRGSVSVLAARHAAGGPQEERGVARLAQRQPGEILQLLDRTGRAALYCQNLVATFVQSARQAAPGAVAAEVCVSELLQALVKEYPLDERERAAIALRVERDFGLRGRRDLLYLVLCTLTSNALQAMREQPQPRLAITCGVAGGGAPGAGWIRFADNGHGVPPELLPRLAQEPVSTRAEEGGSGMGLLFCRRVMESMGGSLQVDSPQGRGTTVTLRFDPARLPA